MNCWAMTHLCRHKPGPLALTWPVSIVMCGQSIVTTKRTISAVILCILVCAPDLLSQDLSRSDIRPVTLTGSLITSAENYSVPGMRTQRPTNTARLFFNPVLSLYGIEMPFSFLLSTNERSYNQPFNQFGVSPTYKWATLHAGYRSLRFSEFTLNDAVIMGGGAEARGDWFRLRGMYGRFRRKVEEDTLTGIMAVYKRMGWAVGGSVGNENSFLDINVLQAWDDSTSLDRDPTFGNVFPAENLVFGIGGQFGFDSNKVVVDGEVAGSFLTRDTRLEDVKDPDVAAAPVDAKISTRFNFAGKLGATYKARLWSLRLGYARVEPEYETMGAIYMQQDYEDITVAPTFYLPDGTLRVNGTIGFRRDNLLEDRNYTTKRVIGSGTVGWMPDPMYGIDAQYSNYSMSNSAGSLQVNDSTQLNNVSESWTLTPRYTLLTSSMQHFIMLLLTRQMFTDSNILTGTMSDNDVLTAVFNYSGTLMSGIGISSALQYTEMETAFLTNIIRGITAGISYSFFERTLNTSLSYTLNLVKASTESDTDTQNLITVAARYRLSRANTLEFRFQYNSYHAVNPSRASYSGTITRLQYSRSFGLGM